MSERTETSDLERLLLRLGFVAVESAGSHRGYRHQSSGTVIVLPPSRANGTANRAHLVAIRRTLVERGVITESSFDDLLHKV